MASSLILLLGLAVWRVTYMINAENGPLNIFMRYRATLAATQKRSGGMYDMISCFKCLSIWVAFFPAMLLSLTVKGIWASLLTWVLLTLILSSEAIIIQRVFDKLK